MSVPSASLSDAYAAHLQSAGGAIDRALQAVRLDGLVIHAGVPHRAFLDDQDYPYRPNPWFLWLAPLSDAPGSLIVWRPGDKPRLVLVIPDDYWHLPPKPPIDPWVKQFEVEIVPTAGEALARMPAGSPHWAWLGEAAAPEGWETNPEALLRHLEQARCRKTPYEIQCIEAATRRGVAGHRAAERVFRDGGSEFRIHLAFLQASGMTEADVPYAGIVALNEHAATLHYQRRDRELPAQRRSLLIDAGAACRGYASDITRTWDGGTEPVYQALVKALDELQQELCRRTRAGLSWPELHLEAHRGVGTLLQAAGILRVDAQAAVDCGLTAPFLPHGLGHLLGLQVHDVGGFHAAPDAPPIAPPPGHPWLRLTRRLEPGFVVTMEPGIYFIPSLLAPLRAGPLAHHVDWALVDRLQPCGGIRIEDNLVITREGHRNLTREAFAAP